MDRVSHMRNGGRNALFISPGSKPEPASLTSALGAGRAFPFVLFFVKTVFLMG